MHLVLYNVPEHPSYICYQSVSDFVKDVGMPTYIPAFILFIICFYTCFVLFCMIRLYSMKPIELCIDNNVKYEVDQAGWPTVHTVSMQLYRNLIFGSGAS